MEATEKNLGNENSISVSRNPEQQSGEYEMTVVVERYIEL